MKRRARVIHLARNVDNHRLIEPADRPAILPHARLPVNMREHVALVVLRELRRNPVEEIGHVERTLFVLLLHVVLVERQNLLLHEIGRGIVLALQESGNNLRHAAHKHVLPERLQNDLMKRSHGLSFPEVITQDRESHPIVLRPQKLLKVHRQDFKRIFFRRNKDILAFLSNSSQRSRLKKIVAPVFQERLQRLPRRREELDFIEDDERFPGKKLRAVFELQLHEKRIEVAQALDEEIFNRGIDIIETDEDVRVVRFPPELLRKRRFPDATRSLEKKRVLWRERFLPVKHFAIDFSLKHPFHLS